MLFFERPFQRDLPEPCKPSNNFSRGPKVLSLINVLYACTSQNLLSISIIVPGLRYYHMEMLFFERTFQRDLPEPCKPSNNFSRGPKVLSLKNVMYVCMSQNLLLISIIVRNRTGVLQPPFKIDHTLHHT